MGELHGLSSLFRIYLNGLVWNKVKYAVYPVVVIILRNEDRKKLNLIQLFRHNETDLFGSSLFFLIQSDPNW